MEKKTVHSDFFAACTVVTYRHALLRPPVKCVAVRQRIAVDDALVAGLREQPHLWPTRDVTGRMLSRTYEYMYAAPILVSASRCTLRTAVSAPWVGVRGAVGPPMSVVHHPGHAATIATLSEP